MRDLSEVTQVKITDSSAEANFLLRDYWTLLEVFHDDCGVYFVLGDIHPCRELCDD